MTRVWRRHQALLEVMVVLALVVAVWSPFLGSARVDDKSLDWTFRTDYVGYELNAILHDHEFPFWVTDGRFEQLRIKDIHDFFANPETDVLSILTPLAALFGLLTAVKVALVVYLGLGVWGCRRLLVVFGPGAPGFLPLLLAALLVLCNGAIVAHVLHGHIQFLAMAGFPLSLSLVLDAFDARLATLMRAFRGGLAGAMLAAAYYSGATHPLFYFLLCFVVLLPVATIIVSPKRWRQVLPGALVVGVSFVVLALFKLLPGFVDFGGYRAPYFLAYDGWRDFTSSFVVPWVPIPGHQLQHETNLYVGWLGVVLLAFALAGIRARAVWPLLLACAATTWIMFLSPESPLLKLPLLRTQGAPTRLRFLLIMVVAVIAVTQIQYALAWARRHSRRAVRIGAIGLAASACVSLAFDLSRTNVARHVRIGCEESPPVPSGPFDQAPELAPTNPRVATVTVSQVLANQFSYDFATSSATPTLLVAKSLHASPPPHLALKGDGELTTVDGALAVRVNGRGRVTLKFYDPLSSLGLSVSLLAVVALAVLGFLARRTKQF